MNAAGSDAFTFRALLRQLRVAAGLTQAELAERAQISVRSVSSMECGGSHRPRSETLRLLAAALNLTPEDRAAFTAVARGRAVLRAAPSISQSSTAPSHELPAPLTALIGREREVATLGGLLRRADVRLLTLCGPPGVGKTRLGLQIAGDAQGDFPDGVCFISLAPVRDTSLVANTIAVALELGDIDISSAVGVLRASLQYKRMLLLLDNFEHLAPAAPLVTDLLAACPRLTILVTSRAALHVRGEREFPVMPLAVPDPAHVPSGETLAQVPSVALFIERAQGAAADFALTSTNAPTLAAICRRLDGLPLAIELAAAWTRLFSPYALLQRLEHRLRILHGERRDLPERQQGLQATLDWSYDLLGPSEQAVFRWLAVFVDGCSLAAVEAICAAFGEVSDTPAGLRIVDSIAALVDQSLLLRDRRASDDLRVRMLETIREYANERLEAHGEADNGRRAHAAYYATLAEAAESHLTGPEQDTWVALLERDHDNVREALRWALEHQESAIALRLGGAMWRFWQVRSHLREGQQWLDRVLTLVDGSADSGSTHDEERCALRAKVLHGAGLLAYYRGDLQAAHRWSLESLTLRRALDDSQGIAQTVNNLGLVLTQLGDFSGALACFQESLQLKRQLGDTQRIASTLNNLGWLHATHGQLAEAVTYYAESLELWQQLGNSAETARTLANLGHARLLLDHVQEAAHLLEESLRLRRRLGDRSGIGHALALMGDVARAQGQDEEALVRWQDALDVYHEADAQLDSVYCLDRLAGAWCRRGHPERATRLLGAASAIRQQLGASLDDIERPGVEQTMAALQAQLGSEAFHEVWEKGAGMTFEEAILCARGERPGTHELTCVYDSASSVMTTLRPS